MEENKEIRETKVSYEELEQFAQQTYKRALAAEARLNALDVTELKFNLLFKALELKECFSTEFIKKCAEAVENLLLGNPEEENSEEAEQKE